MNVSLSNKTWDISRREENQCERVIFDKSNVQTIVAMELNIWNESIILASRSTCLLLGVNRHKAGAIDLLYNSVRH